MLKTLAGVGVSMLALAAPAEAQFAQQGPKLVGTGATGDAEQGHSVSLSGDGNTGIIGGPSDNNDAGAAWVYTRSGGAWAQQAELVGGFTGEFSVIRPPYSVAL